MRSLIRAALSDGSLCMVLYRLMSGLSKFTFTRFIAAIVSKLNTFACGATIGINASFQDGFVILHSVGIVINSKVTGGKGIILESGVVIGEDKGGCPQLGNEIYVASGAKVFGAIKIGDNVSIGANAVVNKDVPSNVVMAGIPAKIVRVKNNSRDISSLAMASSKLTQNGK